MSLLQGMESEAKVTLLLELTKIKSEGIIDAIYDHLCKGHTTVFAAPLNGVTDGQVVRAMTKLNAVHDIIVKLKECD